MLTSYHTLAYVASNLNPRLAGLEIVEAFTQDKDTLALRFDKLEEMLIVSCDRALNTLHLRPHFARARANTTDVLGKSVGKRIAGISIHPVDRVLFFRLDSGERLDARFFGAKANVVLVDGGGVVVDAFKDVKVLLGSTADYRTGEILYDIDLLRKRLEKPALTSVAAMMKEEYPTLGSDLVKEILHRAGVPQNSGSIGLTGGHVQSIQSAMSSVLTDLASPVPRVYISPEPAVCWFSLVPFRHLGKVQERVFDDVHTAIGFYISRLRSSASVNEHKHSLRGKLHQKLIKAQRTLAVLAAERNNARPEEYQRLGELLMTHMNLSRKGDSRIAIEDPAGVVEIHLDPKLTPVQNAQKFFEKAKRSRLAHEQASRRRIMLQETEELAARLLAILDAANTREGVKQFLAENRRELEKLGIGEKSDARQQLPFRVFTVDGGFEVWAGKSSKNNDQLTLKHAQPDDLWFHARGAAGSHVVLKVKSGKGEPGKKAKEQAAGIAAYFSKMKNAKMVPVAMTERKYVRKPKGTAPGSVLVEREKVIFAQPSLPNNVQEQE